MRPASDPLAMKRRASDSDFPEAASCKKETVRAFKTDMDAVFQKHWQEMQIEFSQLYSKHLNCNLLPPLPEHRAPPGVSKADLAPVLRKESVASELRESATAVNVLSPTNISGGRSD